MDNISSKEISVNVPKYAFQEHLNRSKECIAKFYRVFQHRHFEFFFRITCQKLLKCITGPKIISLFKDSDLARLDRGSSLTLPKNE